VKPEWEATNAAPDTTNAHSTHCRIASGYDERHFSPTLLPELLGLRLNPKSSTAAFGSGTNTK